MSRTKSQWAFRFLISVIGLAFCALGMTLATKAALGTNTFGSLPFVLDLLLPPSMGTFVTILSIFYILLQMCILRKEFKPIAFLQFLGSFLSGWFVDMWTFLFRWLNFPNYATRLLGLVTALFVLGFGIALAVETDLMAVPVDTFTSVVARKRGTTFGRVKRVHDIIYISITCTLSLTMLGGLYGAREGTLLSALFLGRIADLYKPFVSPTLQRLCFEPAPLDKEHSSNVK